MHHRLRPSGITRRALLRGSAGIVAASALPGCAADLRPPRGRRLASWLAVGDIGEAHGVEGVLAPQWLVARAMATQHRLAPVDGMLLLGDHFYPDGLARGEFEPRVGEQIVGPYRDFVSLSAEGRRLYGGPERPPRPVRMLGVLGNHDYGLEESPGLQIDGIPRLVTNWHVPERDAETVDLGFGVRAALLQQHGWDGDAPRLLARALAEESADFWIVLGHFPLPEIANRHRTRVEDDLREVYREARERVPVHVQLCGHEHNLQVLRMEPPAPPLHVVSGAGSNTRELSPADAKREFGFEGLGFARVDVLGRTTAESLCVSLYCVDRWTWWAEPAGRLAARSHVDRDGRVRTEVFA